MPRATTFASNSARGEGLFSVGAGAPTWINTLTTSTNPYNEGLASTIDSLGNVYVVGFTATGSGSITNGYGFITQYNKSGAVQWSQKISNGNQSVCVDVATDSLNNVYVVGTYGSSTSIGFIAKFNSSGVWQWQNTLSTSGTSSHAYCLTVDSSNNVYVGGGGQWGGSYGGYVAQISGATGTMNWHADSDWPPAALCNYGGKIYAAGIADESSELLLYSLTSAGAVNWVSAFDFQSNYSANGYYNFPYGNTSLTPPQVTNIRASVSSYGKLYVALGIGVGCFDVSSGSLTWFKTVSNTSVYGVAADSAGSVYYTGVFNGSSMTLGKINLSGSPVWSNHVSSLTSGVSMSGWGVYTDGNYVVATGQYVNSSSIPEVFSGKFPLDGSKTFLSILGFSYLSSSVTVSGLSPATEGSSEYSISNATTGSASYYSTGTNTSSSISFTSSTQSI